MLENIWLAENRIKFIDDHAFDHLSNLKAVYLRENFCVNADYMEGDIVTMRNDIKENCIEKSIQDVLEKSVAELIKQLENQAQEMLSMAQYNNQMKQKLKLLENNFEILNKRVDSVNETSQGVSITFVG